MTDESTLQHQKTRSGSFSSAQLVELRFWNSMAAAKYRAASNHSVLKGHFSRFFSHNADPGQALRNL